MSIKQKIDFLIDERYADSVDFNSFVKELEALGVVRFQFDCLANQMIFYTEKELVHQLERKDLKELKDNPNTVFGKELNVDLIQAALVEFDAGRMLPLEFHKRIYAAGTISCLVFLQSRKIYYFDQTGSFFLENY